MFNLCNWKTAEELTFRWGKDIGLILGTIKVIEGRKILLRKFLYCSLENRNYGRGDPLRWPRNTLYPLKLALTSPAGGGRSVGIVRLRTKAMEFGF
jgi:hypothetical protein